MTRQMKHFRHTYQHALVPSLSAFNTRTVSLATIQGTAPSRRWAAQGPCLHGRKDCAVGGRRKPQKRRRFGESKQPVEAVTREVWSLSKQMQNARLKVTNCRVTVLLSSQASAQDVTWEISRGNDWMVTMNPCHGWKQKVTLPQNTKSARKKKWDGGVTCNSILTAYWTRMKAFLRSSKTLWYAFYSKDKHIASGTKWLSCVKMPQLKQCAAELNKLRNIKATPQDTYRIQQSFE